MVLAQVGTPRASCAGDGAALLSARARVIRDEDSRELAGNLHDKVYERMNHLYTPVRQPHALAVLDDAEKEENKKDQAGRSAARFLHVRRELDGRGDVRESSAVPCSNAQLRCVANDATSVCLLGTSCEASPSAATRGPQSARAHSGARKTTTTERKTPLIGGEVGLLNASCL